MADSTHNNGQNNRPKTRKKPQILIEEKAKSSGELPRPASEENKLSNSLTLGDQTLPPNLFILPINSPIVFPTLLAPLLVTQPRFVAMIEEAINRQRMIGLLLTR